MRNFTKVSLLTVVFMLSSLMTFSQCDWSVALYDSWGDGWNGGSLDVIVDGTVVLDDVTIISGAGPVIYTFSVTEGADIYTVFTAGGWSYENSYDILDAADVVVASVGDVSIPSGTITGYCPTPKLAIGPDPLHLGDWPANAWQEASYLELWNSGTGNVEVTSSELDDPTNFAATALDLPLILAEGGAPVAVGISYTGNTPGIANATYVASWGVGKSVTTADITVNVYAPVTGDIVEDAFTAALPYAVYGQSTASPFYSNYIIPGTATNGKDQVYSFTLTEDMELDFTISNATETPKMAVYAADFNGEAGPMVSNSLIYGGATIASADLYAGSYFVVVSCEADDAAMTYDFAISGTTMPDPLKAFNPDPVDGGTDVTNPVVLSWEFGDYTNEYKLSFGTTYPPTTVLVGWTADLATSYTIGSLDPSMQYFWQVDVRNNNASVDGDVWGFTTTITPPSGLVANVVEIAMDEYNVALNWNGSDKALLGYNVYRDGTMINTSLVAGTSYTDYDLAYNEDPCYEYQVEAIFDEGVSDLSNIASACIPGVGNVEGVVTELLTGLPINGATVKLFGTETYEFTTNAMGIYSGVVMEDTYDYEVEADGFLGETRDDVDVAYGATVAEDFELDEFPFPPNSVVAVEDGEVAVDIYWNAPGNEGGPGGIINENFEGGIPSWFVPDSPEADWHVADNMLTLTTGGASVWRSGYKGDVALGDGIFQVSQQRNGGSEGGSMGVYVRATGLFNGATTMANAFCWTTNGYWWYADIVNGATANWGGWMTSGAISQGLGQENVVSAEMAGSNVTFFINGTEITSVAALETEGFVGGFAHEGTVASEMAFDYWQIIPAGKSANVAENNEVQYEGKGSIEECLSANNYDNGTVAIQGLDYNTQPAVGDKALFGYNVYRQFCDDSAPMEFIGLTLDTNFRDNTWATMDWGMYKWAVEAVYDNNNSEAIYSNCIDKDMLTTVNVEVSTNSGDAPEGCYVLFTNTSQPELELFYDVTLDATGLFGWEGFRKGTYDIDVQFAGYTPIDLDGVDIHDAETFVWVLEELLLPPSDLYVTPTGYATWGGSGAIPFEPYFENFDTQEQFDMWEVVVNGGNSAAWEFVTSSNNGNTLDGTGFAYADSDAAGSGSSTNTELISPVINADGVAELFLSFDIVHQVIGDHMDVDVYDGADWVTVWTSDDDSGPYPWGPTVHKEFDISAYANADLQIRFHYIAGWDWFVGIDNVSVSDATDKYADNKEFQFYKVWHSGTFSTDRDTNFYQYGENETLVAGETYLAEVASLYSTGLSAKAEYEWTYAPCEDFPGWLVSDAYNIEESDDNLVVWSDDEAAAGEDYEEGFEAGTLPTGWTMYDEDGDGYGWDNTAVEDFGFEAHTGDYCMTSASYRNDVGALNPDNWLIAPAIYIGPESELSFWIAAQDAGWADEQYYVKVSTTGTAVGDFTTTIHDAITTGTWEEIVIDLSAFAGETVYIAFQHTDVTDMFWIKMDDFKVTGTPDKAAYTAPVKPGTSTFMPIKTKGLNQEQIDAKLAIAKADKAAKAIEVLGANITRNGEFLAYVALPDTFYLDSNLEAGLYTYCLTKVYTADGGIHTWTSCEGVECYDVEITEDCTPPSNLVATDELGDGFTATLNWEAPTGSGIDPQWLSYGADVNVDAIGGPAEFSYATKWDADQLAELDGGSVTQVKFFPREAGTSFTLKIWKGSDASTLLYEQPLTGLTYDDWNTVALDTPVELDVNEELWVGFYVVTGGYPAGCDNYVGSPNTDLITLDGVVWEHLAGYGLNYSWNLEAYVDNAKGETTALTVVDHATYSGNGTFAVGNLPTSPNAVDATAGAKEFLGYNVYRDGEQINEDVVIETTYLDVLDASVYHCYEVTAVYSYCGESAFSNEDCVQPGVGVEEMDNSVVVYPNPANDFVTVKASSNIRTIEITNYMGQVVSSIKAVEYTQHTINTSDLSAGIYFIEVETAAGIEKVRIVISE